MGFVVKSEKDDDEDDDDDGDFADAVSAKLG